MPVLVLDTPTTGAQRTRFAVAAAGVAVTLAVLLALFWTAVLSSSQRQVLADVSFIVGAAFAAASCSVRAWRSAGRGRVAWTLLAGTGSAWTVGNIFWAYYQLIADAQPYPSLADAFYVVALLCGLGGLLTFPVRQRTRQDVRSLAVLLDGVTLGVAFLGISWVFLIGPAVATSGLSTLGRAVFVGYPVADVVLLTIAITLAARLGPELRRSGLLVAGAIASYSVADSLYGFASVHGTFTIGTPLDVGWIGGYLLLGLAALAPSRAAAPEPEGDHHTPAAWSLLSFLPAILALTLVIEREYLGGGDDPVLRTVGPVLVGLFMARKLLSELENRALRRDLEITVALRTAELRALSRRSASVLDSAGEGIVELDPTGRVKYINRAGAALVGYAADDLLGRQLHDTVHHTRPDGTAYAWPDCGIFRCLSDGVVHPPTHEQFLRKDGSPLPVEVVTTPVLDDGAVTSAVVLFRDISERLAVDRMKDEFVSIVSHELRTPLTSIRGALGLLAGGALGELAPKGKRMADIAVQNTDRLIRLINDILDIERMGSGQAPLAKRECPLQDLLQQAADVMRPMADAAGVTLVVVPTPDTAAADPDRLLQALTNLVGNAVKFSPADSTVRLSAAWRDDEVEFAIADQGRGLPETELDKIFNRFHQVDASDARDKGGTGLGLAICRGIVEQHGGRIWASNGPGGGAVFRFTLPAVRTPRGVLPAETTMRTGTVLVCDDDASVLEVVGALLRDHGYDVLLAASGPEAVEQARKHHPDALVLDLLMPGMTGRDTVATLRELPETRDIPIVILSVTPKNGDLRNISDWVAKPMSGDALCEAVDGAIDRGASGWFVMLVEDDDDLADVLTAGFERHGCTTAHVTTAKAAIELARRTRPDLTVLDVKLREGDGFMVVDALRELGQPQTVTVYTAGELDEHQRRRLTYGDTVFFTKGRIDPEELEAHALRVLAGRSFTVTAAADQR